MDFGHCCSDIQIMSLTLWLSSCLGYLHIVVKWLSTATGLQQRLCPKERASGEKLPEWALIGQSGCMLIPDNSLWPGGWSCLIGQDWVIYNSWGREVILVSSSPTSFNYKHWVRYLQNEGGVVSQRKRYCTHTHPPPPTHNPLPKLDLIHLSSKIEHLSFL